MARRRIPTIYDEGIYRFFGEQPDLFEIQLGYKLFPLVDESEDGSLLQELTYCRNKIDAEYGLPLPPVHIIDNIVLSPNEYSILLKGVEVGKGTVKMGYSLCIDTGCVLTKLDCSPMEKTKDPVYGFDAFFVREEDVEKYRDAGYYCVFPKRVIRTHLYDIIKKYRTRVLNQNLVNTLIEKVRKQNPAVISDVFFMKQFPVSDFKMLLNYLLEEEVSIRDMNTILETIADYYQEDKYIYELAEKVREQLAFNFLRNYVDGKKILHVFLVPEIICKLLIENNNYPSSKKEMPCCYLDPKDFKCLIDSVSESITWFNDQDLVSVLLCPSPVRCLLYSVLQNELPNVKVISDVELNTIKNDINIQVEGEIALNG